MPDFRTTKFIPEFGINCPKPDDLQTGDLLFPRLPTGFEVAASAARRQDIQNNIREGNIQSKNMSGELVVAKVTTSGEHPANSKTLGQLLNDPSPLLHGQVGSVNPTNQYNSQLVEKPTTELATATQDLEHTETQATIQHAAGASQMDTWWLLLNILRSEFSDLTQAWLNMPLRDFLKHPLGKFLLKTLEGSGDHASPSFFVGHVAMVIREQDGVVVDKGGDLLVIEDNTTDFSHYRTAVHPYHVASDLRAEMKQGDFLENRRNAAWWSNAMRGWVDRRSALGQHVWAVRPRVLGELELKQRLKYMQQLADQAKRLHGRPYGFFDHPRLGDDNRMYCAEFIHLVFQRAAIALGGKAPPQLALDGLCTWKWIRDYLNRPDPYGDPKLLKLIDQVLTEQPTFLPDRRFFVITPAMLAESPSVTRLFTPTPVGDQYAAPSPHP